MQLKKIMWAVFYIHFTFEQIDVSLCDFSYFIEMRLHLLDLCCLKITSRKIIG
jgi:hypothetical protein